MTLGEMIVMVLGGLLWLLTSGKLTIERHDNTQQDEDERRTRR